MSQKFIFHAGESALVRRNCNAFLASLPDTKSWHVEIKQYRRTRSDAQNRALFGVAYPVLAEATGYTKDELHDAFCRRFFGTIENDIMGIKSTRAYRTTTTNYDGQRDVIDAAIFSEFYAMVQQVGAEAGIYVPDPEPAVPEHARAAA